MERKKVIEIIEKMETEFIPLCTNTKGNHIYNFYIWNSDTWTIALNDFDTEKMNTEFSSLENQEELITRIIKRLEHGAMYSITTFMELMRLFGK